MARTAPAGPAPGRLDAGSFMAGRPSEALTRVSDDTTDLVSTNEMQMALPGFGGPVARREDPPTSVAAGRRRRGSQLRDEILELHRQHPDGLTDDEVKVLLPHANEGSCSKRRHDLTVEGVLIDSGSTRPTRWGAEAIVWRLA